MAKHTKLMCSSTLLRPLLYTGLTLLTAALVIGGILFTLQLGNNHPADSSSSPIATHTSTTTATETATSETTAESTTTTATEPPTTTTTKYIFKELTFSSPAKTTFTTTESSVSFAGSTDPHSSLTVNGEPVSLSSIGGFAIDQALKEGVNTFRFVSGKKAVTFQVTYAVNILQSVTPSTTVTLEGGSSVQFQAVAHKNATLTATFNGKTQSMSRTVDPDAEAFHDGGDFITYQTTFTLPAGVVNIQKSLGAATITARYNGLVKSLTTGRVQIKPAPDRRIVTVTRDYAETFSGETVNDYSRPTNAYLPAGTVDKIIASGSAAGHTYYRLGCGRWIYTDDVTVSQADKDLTKTALGGGKATVTKQATTLAFTADWKIPYNVVAWPQSYAAPNADIPDYAITSQTEVYIDITFYYTDSTPTLPDLSDSPLFSAASWHTVNGNQMLRLTLRNRGRFYGYSVRWENSSLIFSFKHPNGTANNPTSKPLTGIRIVLDPGHGGRSSGTYGTISGYYEKSATLDYSLILQKKLTALGATVTMTRTTDMLPDNPTMSTRTAYARNNNTDLLLSIHMNGSKAASASGCTLHYFNEYSYDIAKRLTNTMRAVEQAFGIGNREKVTVWSPFFMARVHDCPAVLVECGFMTNAENMAKLIDATYKEQLTNAIVQAVVGYFSHLPTVDVPDAPTTTDSSVPNPSTTSTVTTSTSPISVSGSTTQKTTTQKPTKSNTTGTTTQSTGSTVITTDSTTTSATDKTTATTPGTSTTNTTVSGTSTTDTTTLNTPSSKTVTHDTTATEPSATGTADESNTHAPDTTTVPVPDEE